MRVGLGTRVTAKALCSTPSPPVCCGEFLGMETWRNEEVGEDDDVVVVVVVVVTREKPILP